MVFFCFFAFVFFLKTVNRSPKVAQSTMKRCVGLLETQGLLRTGEVRVSAERQVLKLWTALDRIDVLRELQKAGGGSFSFWGTKKLGVFFFSFFGLFFLVCLAMAVYCCIWFKLLMLVFFVEK